MERIQQIAKKYPWWCVTIGCVSVMVLLFEYRHMVTAAVLGLMLAGVARCVVWYHRENGSDKLQYVGLCVGELPGALREAAVRRKKELEQRHVLADQLEMLFSVASSEQLRGAEVLQAGENWLMAVKYRSCGITCWLVEPMVLFDAVHVSTVYIPYHDHRLVISNEYIEEGWTHERLSDVINGRYATDSRLDRLLDWLQEMIWYSRQDAAPADTVTYLLDCIKRVESRLDI